MKANIILIGVFCVFCSSVSHAEYDASDLGKLFTDKSQRSQIDAARSGGSSSAEPKQADKVNVSGYMKRSDGKNVVWVNGENTLEGSKIGDIKVQQSNIGKNKKVGITVDGTHFHLKPGETWSKETGKTVDNY